MKNKKVSMLIAASAAAATMLVATPSVSSFATTIKHEKNTKTDNTKAENQDSTTKNVQVNNIKKTTNNETKGDKSEKNLNRVDLAQVNLFTGKVVKAPKVEAQRGATGFAVNFNGSDHMTYYNNQNLNPDMVQTEFHSKTQQELYNYLMNPNNRWNAENEAIGLHGGDTANDCVFFVSSALRAIGINIPDNIGYTTNLMSQLQNLGWERETDLSTLEPGDICFASTAHTYVFMGWANKAEGVAWVADNQFSWFGTNFHPRAQASVPNVDVSPTTCYYRLPGNYSVAGNKTQVDMPVNYDYSVGTVNTQGLNVRQEPSLDSSILTCLNYGQRVQILSQNGNWLKINYNGQPAYVWASYITGNTPSVTKPYEGNYNVIGNGVVNFTGGSYTDVMSGGTWYSNLRGTLNNGVKVSIINQNADWYQIEYENGTAWIPKNRLQTDLSYKVIGSGTVAFNGGNYTDIMSEGTWYSNVLGTLNNGTNVKIIGENTDWYKIEYNNGIAWILKSRLQTDLNDKVIGTGKVAFNSGSFTDIMSEGTWYSNVLGTLNNGTNVKIIGENTDWYKIEYNNGIAWILKSRLQTDLNDKVIGTGKVAFNSGSFTDIMSEGTWYSNVLGTLNNGTNVKIIGENTDWYKIEYNNGIAWILKSRLQTDLNVKVIGTGKVDFNDLSYTDIMSEGTWYSNVLGTLNNGTNVKIIGENTDWYKIEYNNGIAWILKSRLQTDLNVKVIGTGKVDFNDLSYTDIMSEGTWYSNVLGTLNNGTNINIIGENSDWYKIEYNNSVAWILKSRVNTKLNENNKIINTGKVNFLSGSYTDIMSEGTWYSNVLGTLNNGTNINIIGENADWYEIQYNNGTAWIPKNRTEVNRKVIEQGQVNFLSGNYTDIMSEGTWYSNVAGTLNNGTNINIVGQNAEWFEIEYNNGTVWIPKNRVHINRKVLEKGQINFLSGNYTDIMSEGTWYSNVAGTLNNGTNVNIIGENTNWYEIEYENGTVWVPKNRVHIDRKVLEKGQINFLSGNYTDIMSEGTWYSNVAGTLNNGTNVNIIGENAEWFEIEYENGLAWVPKVRVNTNIDRKVIQTGSVNFLGGSYTDIMTAGTWYSDVAGTLTNGTNVNIVSQKNNWYEIEYGNGTVWIPVNRVNTLHDTVLGTGTVEFSGGSYTDVMSAGTWYSNVVGTLNNGTNINIVGESGNWYQIEVGNTNVWIPKDRVNTTYGKPAIKTAYINFSGGNFTDIMNGPTWYTSLAGTLVNGTQVSIVGESGSWYEIEYENGTAWVLKDRVGTSQNIYQNAIYSQTMSEYVAQELQEYIDCVGGGLSASQVNQVTNELANAINPQNASTILEFLRVDEYRSVNFNQVQSLLNGKGVFSGQAAAFIGAAKQYNLDPVYLISQSALETGWGTSNFAQGITITQIANENAPIYQNGQLVGYQMINLPQPVTVYDLFGIGAYNASANFPNKTTILATTYAYNHGWTNISNAIYGAAAFLSNNYVHNNDIAQNTPYEIRYIDAPQEDIWHQYATDIQYAESIANIMENIKYVYSQGDSFTFEIPKFQN